MNRAPMSRAAQPRGVRRGCALPACLVGAALAAACATGPAFTAPESPRAQHAAVYVYRVSALPGAMIKHDIRLNGTPVARLLNGSHVRIELPAALPADLHAEGCRPLRNPIRAAAGQVLYVQLALVSKTVELGGKHYFDYGCELTLRSEGDALPVITGLARAD